MGDLHRKMYSVILPTYCEAENLPLMIFMLDKAFRERCELRSMLETCMLRGYSL